MLRQLKQAVIGLGALAVGLAGASAAMAQKPPTTFCSISGSSPPVAVNYDPFNPVPVTSVPITISFTRVEQSGGNKTQAARFYLLQPAGQPPYQVLYNGVNVLYPAPVGSPPTLSNTGSITPTSAGTAIQLWGTASDPDTQVIQLTLSIPVGANLTAGEPLRFDVGYVCKGTGGSLESVESVQTLTNAVTVQINVLSALQASYVGPALNFGEIGEVTDAMVTASPAVYTRSGNVRVASSGPYSVNMSSANTYRLMAGGTDAITYQTTFLGQSVRNSAPNFPERTCVRAGVAGVNLPIATRLLEGGRFKAPSSNYFDTISVTVTPLAVAGSQSTCQTFVAP